MRSLTLVLLLATLAVTQSPAQATEAAISARLMNRPLYLRGFWSDNHLLFDSAGHLEGDSKPESFTLSGFDLSESHLSGDKLVLEGRRVGIEFQDDNPTRVPLEARKPSHHKDVAVRIEIAGSPGSNYGPALDAVFADGIAGLIPSLPTYWKDCATKDLTACKTGENPSIHSPGTDKSIKPPKLLHSKDPDFSKDARKLQYAADGLYQIHIERDGSISHISILRPAGMGLDENAIYAIQHYTFAPAMQNEKPIAVQLNIAVAFQIF